VGLTDVAERITTEWGTIDRTDPPTDQSRKSKRWGKDGSSSFNIDSNSFLEHAEEFLNGYKYGSSFGLNGSPLTPPGDQNIDYTPINPTQDCYTNGFGQTTCNERTDDQLIRVSSHLMHFERDF
jgi:hypothetical protein